MIGERFVVHSSAKPEKKALESFGKLLKDDAPNGVALGTVRLVEVVCDSASSWALPGNYHWCLADPEAFESPIPVLGRLGLWSIELEIIKARCGITDNRTPSVMLRRDGSAFSEVEVVPSL